NPSTGPASLDLDLYENTGFVWSILDGTGRLVQTELVEEKSTHHRISIDLNGRPEGLYFVKITLPAGEMRSLPLVKTGK
ncbi:MAG: T9SS type A sorting domain-containing protein, partial [Saprospiraceae bacterium]|nr:T9SS type A sorting domain-containing protein [Saprospiraceae bacterium]